MSLHCMHLKWTINNNNWRNKKGKKRTTTQIESIFQFIRLLLLYIGFSKCNYEVLLFHLCHLPVQCDTHGIKSLKSVFGSNFFFAIQIHCIINNNEKTLVGKKCLWLGGWSLNEESCTNWSESRYRSAIAAILTDQRYVIIMKWHIHPWKIFCNETISVKNEIYIHWMQNRCVVTLYKYEYLR